MKISDKFWNLLAPIYALLRRNPVSNYFLKKENQAIEQLFGELVISEIKTVCDLGVGRGHSLNLIPDTISLRLAIDKSKMMMHYTRNEFPGVNFVQADVLNLPLKSESQELVICVGLIEYIHDLEPLIEKLNLIIKHEGHIILSNSPKNIFTYLRMLRGHRIFARKSDEIE